MMRRVKMAFSQEESVMSSRARVSGDDWYKSEYDEEFDFYP